MGNIILTLVHFLTLLCVIANTRDMSVGTDTNHLQMDNGDIITSCTEFRYLVTIRVFTKDGRNTKNIRHRIIQARKIISALNGVWWSKNTTRNRKKMIYNSMVRSVLIYGAETWSLYEDERRRINGTEMDEPLRTVRPIYRTDIPLPSRCCIIYFFFFNKYKY